MKHVSVICPVFNTDPAMLRAAAHSVLQQDGGAVQELVMVDDASTDAPTLQMLSELASTDPRVRVLRNPGNLGPAGSRNAGIRAARGDWIGFLDADDLWPSGSLALRLAAPASGQDCILGGFEELCAGDVMRDADPMPLEGGQDLGDDWVDWRAPQSTRGVIGLWRPLGALLTPKAALERAGLFDERLRYGEDWLLLLRLTMLGRVVATNRPLYVLRRQHHSMMSSRARLTRAFSQAVETAYADPALLAHRKQLRWALLRQYKDMAANSLANGERANGLRCALLAYRVDPREVRPLLTFLRAVAIGDPQQRQEALRGYSTTKVMPGLV
jgi:glycosyltransferase involved in cell wall biosynthesis